MVQASLVLWNTSLPKDVREQCIKLVVPYLEACEFEANVRRNVYVTLYPHYSNSTDLEHDTNEFMTGVTLQ